MGDATERVLELLVEIGISAAWVLGSIVVVRVAFVAFLAEKAARAVPPEHRATVRRSAWSTLVSRRPPAPADPYLLSVPVTVPPSGDEPGWVVMAPGPAHGRGPTDEIHGRMDARIVLEAGMTMLVYRMGRVGALVDDVPVLRAAERAERARSLTRAPRRVLGPVDRVELPFGEGWRTTWVYEHSGKALTDTHVDHDGWAYIVGVLSSSHHARAVDVLDRILATWRWLPLPVTAPEPPPW